ncbi:SOS response-associated peptidase [Roseivivax marinus]|uniref:SOS response-associated peptidase n=1 Tax=Roseivivax marinus TaxID=1379903 RepID=UPI001F03A3E0|nr:SOS response-associated peptidase [Roseivivax marinus]UMA64616.1 SOS response-associated peptidase [Roseivivax marinus]
MCNLYSLSKGQAAIRELFDGIKDRAGNLPELSEVYPDYNAPIVRNGDDGLELTQARWGLPSPQFALKGKKVDKGVTNVRNTKSPHWRRWLGPEHRCLVPFTAFSEPSRNAEGKYEPVWFALDETRPIAFFAGIFVPGWTSVRKMKEGEVTADLYGFLTTEPNAEVAKVHPKAMPVILTTAEERETWLTASWNDAAPLQHPVKDGALVVLK